MQQQTATHDPEPTPALSQNPTFGKTLRQILEGRRLTIRETARRSDVHPTHLGRLLHDESVPRPATLQKLLRALQPVDQGTVRDLYRLSGNEAETPETAPPPEKEAAPEKEAGPDLCTHVITISGNVFGNVSGNFHYTICIQFRPDAVAEIAVRPANAVQN